VSRAVAAAFVLLALTGCARSSGGSTGAMDSGVRGVVLAGPQCPVESASSPCPDRPWAGVVEARRAGDLVRQRTDAEGRFELRLAPGTWTVTPVVEGAGPPSARPVQVQVRAHAFTTVTLTLDTGIR
jgi:hypothetical protein